MKSPEEKADLKQMIAARLVYEKGFYRALKICTWLMLDIQSDGRRMDPLRATFQAWKYLDDVRDSDLDAFAIEHASIFDRLTLKP